MEKRKFNFDKMFQTIAVLLVITGTLSESSSLWMIGKGSKVAP
jgi:hypothetical protein